MTMDTKELEMLEYLIQFIEDKQEREKVLSKIKQQTESRDVPLNETSCGSMPPHHWGGRQYN